MLGALCLVFRFSDLKHVLTAIKQLQCLVFFIVVFDDYIGQDQVSANGTGEPHNDLADGLIYLNHVKSENDLQYQPERNLEVDMMDLLALATGRSIGTNPSLSAVTNCVQSPVISEAYQAVTVNGGFNAPFFNSIVSNPSLSSNCVTVPSMQVQSRQQQLIKQLLEMQTDVSSAQVIAQLLNQMQADAQVQPQQHQQVVLPIPQQQQQQQQQPQLQQQAAPQPKLTMTLEAALQLMAQAGVQQPVKRQIQLHTDLAQHHVVTPQITQQQVSIQQPQFIQAASTAPLQFTMSTGTGVEHKPILQNNVQQSQTIGAQRVIVQQVQAQHQHTPVTAATVALPQSLIINTQPRQQPQLQQPQQPSQITLQQLQQV